MDGSYNTQDAVHAADATESVSLIITHHGDPFTLDFSPECTISDLSAMIADRFSIPPENQKFIISPRIGLVRPPFTGLSLPLSSLTDKKIVLMGSTTHEVAAIDAAVANAKSSTARRAAALRTGQKVQPSRQRDWQKVQEEAQYTFHTIRPLEYLPKPDKSHRFLKRLCDDAGIKASMRKHKFSVGLLTEMNPAEHTTHESRTLGLNRNRGEAIELRLRTDAYDGYRDYKTIRKTLCHELAHNVWGEHDHNFWKLCREIEGEVERGDWRHGGHSVGQEEFYNPEDGGIGDQEADHGGWTGGEYVLGSANTSVVPTTSGQDPLNRREISAKAAEERAKRQRDVRESASQESRNEQDSPPT
ncbi:hypothetical protein LTR50_002597 [Elasticomyces elasticus]|nr:hypothetical protein LTR50_002597 [Elasticomyces elasticus]